MMNDDSSQRYGFDVGEFYEDNLGELVDYEGTTPQSIWTPNSVFCSPLAIVTDESGNFFYTNIKGKYSRSKAIRKFNIVYVSFIVSWERDDNPVAPTGYSDLAFTLPYYASGETWTGPLFYSEKSTSVPIHGLIRGRYLFLMGVTGTYTFVKTNFSSGARFYEAGKLYGNFWYNCTDSFEKR